MQSAESNVLDGLAAPRDHTLLARPHEPPLPIFAEHVVNVSSDVHGDTDRRMEGAFRVAAWPDPGSGVGYPTRTHWSRMLYFDLLGVEPSGEAWSRGRSITRRIRKTIVAGTEKVAVFTRQLLARRRQHRETWAAYDALRQLDDHTLRDLGFERSKSMRVVSEGVIARATVRQLEGSL